MHQGWSAFTHTRLNVLAFADGRSSAKRFEMPLNFVDIVSTHLHTTYDHEGQAQIIERAPY